MYPKTFEKANNGPSVSAPKALVMPLAPTESSAKRLVGTCQGLFNFTKCRVEQWPLDGLISHLRGFNSRPCYPQSSGGVVPPIPSIRSLRRGLLPPISGAGPTLTGEKNEKNR